MNAHRGLFAGQSIDAPALDLGPHRSRTDPLSERALSLSPRSNSPKLHTKGFAGHPEEAPRVRARGIPRKAQRLEGWPRREGLFRPDAGQSASRVRSFVAGSEQQSHVFTYSQQGGCGF